MTATATLLAWHGNAGLKAEVVARMKAHRAADSIVQGFYQSIQPSLTLGYIGCALGCTLPKLSEETVDQLDAEVRAGGNGWWGRIQTEYGIPRLVARLIDDTFERQEWGKHAEFAVDVVEAIPVGADLAGIHDAWVDELMIDADPGEQAEWLIAALAAGANPGVQAEWLIAALAAAPILGSVAA